MALSIQCAELVGHESRLAARSLHHLAGLRDLPITHCKLCGLQSLVHLNLSHNSVKDVKDAGLGGDQCALSSLASLDLSHNQLQQVPGAGLQSAPGLGVIILSNNHTGP